MLDNSQIAKLKELMINSARKGNLANSGLVLENGKVVETAESWVITNTDATAHSERMLVSKVCAERKSNRTPGLTMVTVVEPCLMCLSACSQASYKEIAYIIPGDKYVNKIPWATDIPNFDKKALGKIFSSPIELIHLKDLEEEFSKIFEEEMEKLTGIKLP